MKFITRIMVNAGNEEKSKEKIISGFFEVSLSLIKGGLVKAEQVSQLPLKVRIMLRYREKKARI